MRLLLDSHVVLWWLDDHEDLGASARDRIRDATAVLVSVVTPWELGIKRALGKLHLPEGLVPVIAQAGFELLPIVAAHAELAAALPFHHRDPFDRMLIAQAQLEGLTLVTADDLLRVYDIETVDARR